MNVHKLIQRTAVTVGLLCLIGVVRAQTVTLTAAPTSAIGSTPVTLTWSTNPTATSCTASGDWTGSKAASGTQTLTAITASKSYTLTCAFPTTVSVPLTWTPPTTNTDNSPLTNLASYKVYFGTSATTMTQTMSVPAPSSGAPVLNVANGSWVFAVTAISSTGKESVKSNTTTKTVAALSASDTETVTVTPDTTPNPPSNLTVVEPVAYDVRPNEQTFAFDRGRAVGVVKLGAACDEERTTGGGFYALERPSKVRLTRPPRSVALVAKCQGA
jgi:hypothetical protein